MRLRTSAAPPSPEDGTGLTPSGWDKSTGLEVSNQLSGTAAEPFTMAGMRRRTPAPAAVRAVASVPAICQAGAASAACAVPDSVSVVSVPAVKNTTPSAPSAARSAATP